MAEGGISQCEAVFRVAIKEEIGVCLVCLPEISWSPDYLVVSTCISKAVLYNSVVFT